MLLTQTISKTFKASDLFHLDNAGKLYPAISSTSWSAMFRVSAILKSEINSQILQKALDSVLVRFPMMNVSMSAGIFWYYLKKNPNRLIIELDNKKPCNSINWRIKNAHLMRVLYKQRSIAVEFFHAVTDGTGAMIFLKSLLGEYLRLTGIDVTYDTGVIDPKSNPRYEEMIDAYQQIPLPKEKKLSINSKVYQFPHSVFKGKHNQIVAYSIHLPDLKNKAQAIGVTITEYLAAVILYIGHVEQAKGNYQKKLPIRLAVPVNMRRFFPTESLRNFSWIVSPEIPATFKDKSFEEIALMVQSYMKDGLKPDNLFKGIGANVAAENNPLFKFVPLPIKNLVIGLVYKIISNNTNTMTLTNLGVFNGPQAMMDQIETAELMLGPSQRRATGSAVVTTGDRLVITFTSTEKDPFIPQEFAKIINEKGIGITEKVIWKD